MKSNSDRCADASAKRAGFKRARRTGAAAAPPSAASPISRFVAIDEIPEAGFQIRVSADEAERAALAKADGLIGIESLEADLAIAKKSATKFSVAGPLRARVVQTCVVSLEEFETDIEAEVEAEFVVPDEKSEAPGRSSDRGVPASAQIDAPEPIVDGRIDVGALVEEFFVLSLDPHPRKPGVRFDAAEYSQSSDGATSPFAALKKLKDQDR